MTAAEFGGKVPDIVLRPDIRMSLEEARRALEKISLIDPGAFTKREDFLQLQGFPEALAVVASYIITMKPEAVARPRVLNEKFEWSNTWREDKNKRHTLSVTRKSPVTPRELNKGNYFLTYTTPEIISVTTRTGKGKSSLELTFELDYQYPTNDSGETITSFFDEESGNLVGISNYDADFFKLHMGENEYKMIAHGVKRCSEIMSKWPLVV